MALLVCPVCGGRTFAQAISIDVIRTEIRLRQDFVRFRLNRKAGRRELKDLTEFMHGFPVPLISCSRCGVLVRGEHPVADTGAYEEDPNDPDLMAQLFPRYLEAFRHKKPAYGDFLQPHAGVLEVGSHLGAFLQTSEEWNWRAIGLDIGVDVVRFVKSKGLPVHRGVIEDSPFPDRSFDAVFVWNCFEQIPDPATTLVAIHRALKRHGMLLIRVPNAIFYRALGSQLKAAEEDEFALQALGYNNLLGFPYLYGYTAALLNRLISQYGFEYVRGFNSELVTMPFPDLKERISREQKAISEAVGHWRSASTLEAGEFTGPWIEMVYLKVEEDAWRARRQRGPAKVLARSKNKIDLRFLERAA